MYSEKKINTFATAKTGIGVGLNMTYLRITIIQVVNSCGENTHYFT